MSPPAEIEALLTEAMALQASGRFGEAEGVYRELLGRVPGLFEATANLGTVLVQLGRAGEAVGLLRAAAAMPEGAGVWELHNNLGNALRDGGDLGGAIGSLRRATELAPGAADAWMNLGNALKDVARHDEALAAYQRAAMLRPNDAALHANLVYALMFHPRVTPAAFRRACEQWDALHARPLARERKAHAVDRSPGRRLRVGLVGADFRRHAQSHFTVPLLEHWRSEGAVPIVYSSTAPEDDITARLRAAVGRAGGTWVDALPLDDGELAERVRADRVDVLIDLTMHMAGCRLLALARKPAPVQATWLAYPGTTGSSAMNFRLTDPQLDPPGLGNDADYTEAMVRLADTFWCYDPLTPAGADEPEPGPLPAARAGVITFGSLNAFSKVTEATLDLWRGVLEAVPSSRLRVLAPLGEHREAALSRLGVEPARVEFVSPRARGKYLELFREVDIMLDTAPVPGHTTTLDALYMGVPVVTRVSPGAVGRGGAAILTHAGLPELIAADDAAYIRAAVALAGDGERLADLRRTLRARLRVSPLMDGPRFGRAFDAAVRQMWHAWCGVA